MDPQLAARRLDDPAGIAAGDPAEMLRAVASSAAQVREAAALTAEADLTPLSDAGRPRAVVALGMGGSGIAGDVLAAVAGPGCPVPVLSHKGYGLPGWVGAADLVIAVSCSGSTEETLSAADEALRRGARMLYVGGAGSPLQERAEQSSSPFVPVPQGRQPRASMWALSVPLVLAGAALGLLDAPAEAVEAAAARLEQVSVASRPDSESFVNPAKSLALSLVDALPMVWGTSPLTGVAAYRIACQLNENAKTPAVYGVLPEANHNQVVAFDGPWVGGGAGPTDPDDFFRDRGDDDDDSARLRLLLLRDDPSEVHPQVTRRADVSVELARSRGLGVEEVTVEGASRLERLASVVGLLDYATVYLGLALGLDPTPVAAIQDLKARIAR